MENAIEWLTGQDRIAVSFSQKRFANRLKRLAEQFPDEVDIIENQDGSVFGHMPLSWLKFRRPRDLSEEQRQEIADRLANSQNTGNKKE